jgi:serine/threonine protein kinase
MEGSVSKRATDFSFISTTTSPAQPGFWAEPERCHWSKMMVPGELKSNPTADGKPVWIQLANYAREVLSAQWTRRFTLGFNLCGKFMRTWAYDRAGGVSSCKFDINENGRQFVATILAFLNMDDEQLGFDPTIREEGGAQIINITKEDGSAEQLILTAQIHRARSIVGRATTCWTACRKGEPESVLLVKDSWQHPEHEHEGLLLREVAQRGVVNVARYYHHETVQVRGMDDDIMDNIRRQIHAQGPDIRKPPGKVARTLTTRSGSSFVTMPRSQASSSRPSSLAPRASTRVHRRIVIQDVGRPVYEAKTLPSLLGAFEGCIEGHESLHKAGFLHRDISINNMMINEGGPNEHSQWSSFLIDLDLAIKRDRVAASGAGKITGTLAFMAMGLLHGQQHSFMHDLESFFWVLLWICIHYPEGRNPVRVPDFEEWHYRARRVRAFKLEIINTESDLDSTMSTYFQPRYRPLYPLFRDLRNLLFPDGRQRDKEDEGLYAQMKSAFRNARMSIDDAEAAAAAAGSEGEGQGQGEGEL